MAGESSRGNYDVFLSFRGSDTRRGFVNALYHILTHAGICVFEDDKDNPLGAKIEEIMDAVGNSKICVPVFSKNYASSKWCLRELEKMIACKKKIIPVFYDVTPDDVKLKTSLYTEALRAHHREMGGQETSSNDDSECGEQIKQWGKALREACTFTGKELRYMTGYGQLSESIRKEVLNYLGKNKQRLPKHLVKIEAHVKGMLKLLDIEAHDVRYVGIHGMVGSGKTTLAKVIFNELFRDFEYSSFLSDIRESSSQGEGIKLLQKQLLNDLGCKSIIMSDTDAWIKRIEDISHNKRVLLVLDNVNKKEQIDKLAGNSKWFAPGSRIIVTSRDKRILAFEKRCSKPFKGVSTLEMQEMKPDQALWLFSRHAFGADSPPEEYKDLADEAVSISGYLPLSLEIIGSFLHLEQINVWEQKVETLSRTHGLEIQDRFKEIYGALDPLTQELFLDIACFLINTEKTNAMYMWKDCMFHPETGMDELVSLSLVKIVGNIFWMHDHFRDFGRYKVYLENHIEPGKRSRLWKYEEALAVLERKEGTETVKAMRLPSHGLPLMNSKRKYSNSVLRRIFSPSTDHDFKCKSFRYLRNLRFLELWANKKGDRLNLAGDFRGLLTKLRWLSWHGCPYSLKASNLNLENLVVLDLSYSDITNVWDGWTRMKIGNNLKVLDLSQCWGLRRTPDLSKFPSLEKLMLQGCRHLTKIDSSIGTLRALKHLNVKQCNALRGLPRELCSLENLEEILVQGGSSPFILPTEIGNLKSLAILELVGVQIAELPSSVSRLGKLKRLSLKGCSGIDRLPESLDVLKSLVELDISSTGIPESILSLEGVKVIFTQNDQP